MKPIIELKQKQEEKVDDSGMEKFATVVSEAFTTAQKPLIEAILGRENRTAKIIKPARVPAWTKTMTLEVYLKALEVWMDQNKDIPEHVKYNDVVESLKQNKEVSGLEKYLGEHILPVLDTIEQQTVLSLVGVLKRKYGKTRMEEIEELVMEWMNFKPNDYEDEDEYLLAMERLQTKKETYKVKEKEWFLIYFQIPFTSLSHFPSSPINLPLPFTSLSHFPPPIYLHLPPLSPIYLLLFISHTYTFLSFIHT